MRNQSVIFVLMLSATAVLMSACDRPANTNTAKSSPPATTPPAPAQKDPNKS